MTNGFVVATDPARPPVGLERAVYAIGNFDGVHLGHQAVIARSLALAGERGAPSAILTFEPHPADYFADRPVAFRLTPAKMKARLFAEPRTFGRRLPVLRRRARVDDRGGVRRRHSSSRGSAPAPSWSAGTFISARPARERRPFSPRRAPGAASPSRSSPRSRTAPEMQARVVSSTAIRRALERGDVEAAARGLGRYYSVSGRVIPGQQLGRALGVPTANIALDPTTRLAYRDLCGQGPRRRRN